MDFRTYAKGETEIQRAKTAEKVRKYMATSVEYGKWAEAAPEGNDKQAFESLCLLFKSMATDAFGLYCELREISQKGERGEYAKVLRGN